jgi:ribosomal protein S18 acetylase RimI-like enzyme
VFVANEVASGAVVGTGAALHNPEAGDCRFPFGGEVAYLTVEAGARRRGLGRALCTSALRLLIEAGYESVRVGTDETRPEAIRLYRRLGFRPFIYNEESRDRWAAAVEAIGREPSSAERGPQES